MQPAKEAKNQSRPSSVGGKQGYEIKVKKEAPKSKLGPSGAKASELPSSKLDSASKGNELQNSSRGASKEPRPSIQSSQMPSQHSPVQIGASEMMSDPNTKSTSHFGLVHLDRTRSDKVGNEVYKSLLQIHTNLKIRSYENLKVDSGQLNSVVGELIGQQKRLNEKVEILRAYYSLIDKDSKTILEDLTIQNAPPQLAELVNSVKESQKHFHLFLQHIKKNLSKEKMIVTRNEPPKKKGSSDKPNARSVVNDFRQELLEYIQSSESIDELKSRKEAMFPYGNVAILEDFRKINNLSLLIKLLKKDQRTQIEELKIKTYLDLKASAEDSKSEFQPETSGAPNQQQTDPQFLINDDDSPTLKKLKELNRKFCSDQMMKKA